MQVAVLVIIYRGKEHITLHENDAAAWTELLQFVDKRSAASSSAIGSHWLLPDEERLRRFFEAEGDSFILGNADLSEVEAHIDASIGSICPS